MTKRQVGDTHTHTHTHTQQAGDYLVRKRNSSLSLDVGWSLVLK